MNKNEFIGYQMQSTWRIKDMSIRNTLMRARERMRACRRTSWTNRRKIFWGEIWILGPRTRVSRAFCKNSPIKPDHHTVCYSQILYRTIVYCTQHCTVLCCNVGSWVFLTVIENRDSNTSGQRLRQRCFWPPTGQPADRPLSMLKNLASWLARTRPNPRQTAFVRGFGQAKCSLLDA